MRKPQNALNANLSKNFFFTKAFFCLTFLVWNFIQRFYAQG